MLENNNQSPVLSKEEIHNQLEKAKEKLIALELKVQEKELPVIIVIEGLSASGKGAILSQILLALDPRFFKSYSITPPGVEERKQYPMKRFWDKLPKFGDFAVFDRSWYRLLLCHDPENCLSAKEFSDKLKEIQTMERQWTDNGYLLIKLFLNISKEEQEKRLSHLEEKKTTKWRVTPCDRKQNREFDRVQILTNQMLEKSNFSFAPWHIIDATHEKQTVLTVYQTLITEIERKLNQPKSPAYLELPQSTTVNTFDKSRKSDKQSFQKYREELKEYQKKLSKYHSQLYFKKIPTLLVFEGFDAAGKGGAIKRVAMALDGRGYQVNPISAPSEEEKERHYLWRFYHTLPKEGHIAIYDRSWYGRVLVERVEKLCAESDWKRAYLEINEFEKSLTDWGAILIKFFLKIDSEEQLKRFQAREATPLKRHKITDEDWRNRGKWSQYEIAVKEMLAYTSTPYARWNVIDGNNKQIARLKILSQINHTIKQVLSQQEKEEEKNR